MAERTPRIRMFAGPNGSGKSTMINGIDSRLSKLFLNADNLEKDLKNNPVLDLSCFDKRISATSLINYLSEATRPSNNSEDVTQMLVVPPIVDGTTINFTGNIIDSYLCARILDHIRNELLELKVSFTFETVMSHISKIEFLRRAKAQGYRTYFYFVTTEDPEINIRRVEDRVKNGGHAVAEQKIRERYYRTMNMLIDAIEVSDRCFLFDNSKDGFEKSIAYICEIVDGQKVNKNPKYTGESPIWFLKYVLVYLVESN